MIAYLVDLAQWFLIFAILIGGMGFFVGMTGLPFVGYVGFFAIGAYCSAVVACKLHLAAAFGFLLGLALTAMAAAALSVLFLRLTGQLLLIASLGFCEIVRAVAECSAFTNGGAGLSLPYERASGTGMPSAAILAVSLGTLVSQILVQRRLLASRVGRFLHCLREDPELLSAGGRSPYPYAATVFVFTALTASLAGSLYAHHSRYIDPTSFTIGQALQILLALMIGGLGSQRGSIAAAVLIVVVPGLLRLLDVPVTVAGGINQIFFALVVIVLTRRFPGGVFGKYVLP